MDSKKIDPKKIKRQQIYLDAVEKLEKKSSSLPLQLTDLNLYEKLEFDTPVKQNRLINLLNYLNFTQGHVFLNFDHPVYKNEILVKVLPGSCKDGKLECGWEDQSISDIIRDKYIFKQMFILNSQSLILIQASVKKITSESIFLHLSGKGYKISERYIQRYSCVNIKVEISQHGILFNGEVIDFQPNCFQVRLNPESSCNYKNFNPDSKCYIKIWKLNDTLYSGCCEHIRNYEDASSRVVVFKSIESIISRYGKTRIRNPRRELFSPPLIKFVHPFYNRKIKHEIYDISNTDFSVIENVEKSVLMPGMIIPKATIVFAGILEVACKVQVLYCMLNDNHILSEFVILDMDVQNFTSLSQIIDHYTDHHTYISAEVDMDALWEFFFNTGFIYPLKYKMIQDDRKKFKETYKKLYENHPYIARYITYEKEGKIFGHISMIRAFEKTWLIQHHAARSLDNKLPGLLVLKKAITFLNGIYQMPSVNMDYVMCFYTPENKFPEKTFGDFCQYLNNSQGCSLDLFLYCLYNPLKSFEDLELSKEISLQKCRPLDLWQLNNFYEYHSGGMLLKVFNLDFQNTHRTLETDFKKLGLIRKIEAFSVTFLGKLCAVLVVNQSNRGMNLSDLLNGITVFAINQELLSWKILSTALEKLIKRFNFTHTFPVLVYPNDYLDKWELSCDKSYYLWILNLRYAYKFIDFMKTRFRT